MSDASIDTRLTLNRTIAAPVGDVFQAWIRPELLQRWMGPGNVSVHSVEADAKSGGSYRIHMREPGGKDHIVTGTYVTVVPDERLVFTWQWSHDASASLVTIDFRGRDGQTDLVLMHEKLPSAQAREMHTHGWNGCLDKLQGDFDGATATLSLACNCGYTSRGVDRYLVEGDMWVHALKDHRDMLLGLNAGQIASWLRDTDRALVQPAPM